MTTVTIPDELAHRLAATAAKRGVSVDEVVTALLAEHAAPAEVAKVGPESLFALGGSGRGDVSERLDELIAERFRKA